mmetsp:Transcript_6776/g.12150  ORF Transcript_6776/g.12150 Transcript_6776/m.12150 type:complete len:107 (+) Transcript_6776:115-435(+)
MKVHPTPSPQACHADAIEGLETEAEFAEFVEEAEMPDEDAAKLKRAMDSIRVGNHSLEEMVSAEVQIERKAMEAEAAAEETAVLSPPSQASAISPASISSSSGRER